MNFINVENYTFIYYQILLLIVILVASQGSLDLTSNQNINSKKTLGNFLFIIILLYIGLRPLNYRFGDMVIYEKQFQNYLNGAPLFIEKDPLFEYFKYGIAKIASSEVFFFLCAFFYIIPLYFFSKKIFNDYWFYSFFILVISFSFWTYGTNGIRNGIATSVFLYGLSRNNKFTIVLILFLSSLIHKSMLLPLFGYLLTILNNNNKYYFYFWFACIPLSLIFSGFFTNLFLTLGIVEQKSLEGYLGDFNQASEGVELKIGFRWDFLLYSASGVFAGWYYIFKKNYQDIIYKHIFNMFLFSNAFWILVIRSNYSNRLAYLSWFMLGVVIIYPLIKHSLFDNQHKLIVKILIAYFAFTYIMNVLIYN